MAQSLEMIASQVVERVCRMPIDFQDGSNRSMAQLLRDSGVLENPEALTFFAVLATFINHNDWVDAWLRWSGNKRVSSGWYFKPAAGDYVVGYFPEVEILNFTQKERACSEFVLREVSELITAAMPAAIPKRQLSPSGLRGRAMAGVLERARTEVSPSAMWTCGLLVPFVLLVFLAMIIIGGGLHGAGAVVLAAAFAPFFAFVALFHISFAAPIITLLIAVLFEWGYLFVLVFLFRMIYPSLRRKTPGE